MKRSPSPPKHLSPKSKKWFRQITRDFEIEPAHFPMLVAAAEAIDRADAAREILAKDGMVIHGRQGKKPHPACAIARDAGIMHARLMHQLNLGGSDAAAGSPPRHDDEPQLF